MVYLVQDSDSGFVAKGITTDDATLTAELAATTMALNTLGDTPVWTEAEAGTTTLWGHTVSELQSGVVILRGAPNWSSVTMSMDILEKDGVSYEAAYSAIVVRISCYVHGGLRWQWRKYGHPHCSN